jgi:hypothetical protein
MRFAHYIPTENVDPHPGGPTRTRGPIGPRRPSMIKSLYATVFSLGFTFELKTRIG